VSKQTVLGRHELLVSSASQLLAGIDPHQERVDEDSCARLAKVLIAN
jgi:hypothetical protein